MKSNSLSSLLREIAAADVTLYRDGSRVYLGDPADPGLRARVEVAQEALHALVIPSVTQGDREAVRALLGDLGVVLVTEPQAARAAVSELLSDANGRVVAIDTETGVLPEYRHPIPVALTKTGTVAKLQPKDGAAGYALDPKRSRVRLLQAYGGGRTVYLFDMALVSWHDVRPLFGHDLALFNAVFDIKAILASGGPEPAARVYDTMVAMRLLGACERWPVSMAEAADELLDLRVPKGLGASDWSGVLTEDQLVYAAVDALVTWRLWEAQRAAFDPIDENSLEISDGCLVAVARMELAGMPVDTFAHRDFIAAWEAELAEAQASLDAVTNGHLKGVPTDTQVREYLAEVLDDEQLDQWPTTGKTGALSVAQPTFAQPIAQGVRGLTELAQVRTWTKAISTYGKGLLARVDDGRVHTRFLVAAARTGRFSSREPNLQNIPKRSKNDLLAKFRRIFRAPPGRIIAAADYSQIELRAMAELSGNETMRAAFGTGTDVHMAMARALAPDWDSLTDDERKRARSLAKSANFGLIYGSGPRAFAASATANGTPISEQEAAEIIATWRDTYPGIAEWQAEQTWRCKSNGCVETLGGRRWWFEWRAKPWDDPRLDDLEDYQVEDFVAGFERNFSLNMPVQGVCAEIMQVALAYLDERLRPYDARVIATVHDEVVVEAADDPKTVRAVRHILEDYMTRAWVDFFPDAPRTDLVEVGVGPTWAEAH